MIKNKISLGLLLSYLIFVSGCYDSSFSLSTIKKSPIDHRLINNWEVKEKDEKMRVIISQFNDYEYLIMFYITKATGNPAQEREGSRGNILFIDSNVVEIYRGFTFIIDNVSIMCLQQITSDPPEKRPVTFVKYIFAEGDNLQVWYVGDGLLKGSTSSEQAERYAFIKKQIHNEKLLKVGEFKPREKLKIYLAPDSK
jgi:hypothetical protein